VGISAAAVVGLGLAFATGAVAALTERLRYSQSNTSRSTIYSQAFDGAVQSPLFGNGAPRPSNLLNISVGTQGQVWNVMFSYGFVGLAFFLAFFAVVAFASRRAADPVALWIHAAVVVAFATFFYYGYDGPQLAVLMVACALALRRSQDTRRVQAPVPPVVALTHRGR
jgi:O-antigen ligase